MQWAPNKTVIVFFHRDDGKEYHLINWYSRTSFKFSHSISLVLLMIPLTVGVKVYLIHFLFRRELVVLVWIVWRNLSTLDFFDPEIVIWGLTSLTDFYKRIRLLLRKGHVLDCRKKISFDQIMHLKLIFVSPDNIKSYY